MAKGDCSLFNFDVTPAVMCFMRGTLGDVRRRKIDEMYCWLDAKHFVNAGGREDHWKKSCVSRDHSVELQFS